MRYFEILWISLRVKRYYLKIKTDLKSIFLNFLSYIYIFTRIKFKIGTSKK